MTKDEALKRALEALELHGNQYPHMVKGYCLDAITTIKQALSAQPAVPEGWKLVPMRSTEEMIDVAATMLDDAGGWAGKLDMHEMWETLLAAAPEKGQP